MDLLPKFLQFNWYFSRKLKLQSSLVFGLSELEMWGLDTLYFVVHPTLAAPSCNDEGPCVEPL